MVTGDNIKTAKSIAVDCGILRSLEEAAEPIFINGTMTIIEGKEPNIIEGKSFRELSDKDRERVAENLLVFNCFVNLWFAFLM